MKTQREFRDVEGAVTREEDERGEGYGKKKKTKEKNKKKQKKKQKLKTKIDEQQRNRATAHNISFVYKADKKLSFDATQRRTDYFFPYI